MKNIFYVSEYRVGKNDDEAIFECFGARTNCAGEATVVFSGEDYLISRAIEIPSDTTVIVDGCMIKLCDGSFDNVFRGNNYVLSEDNPFGFPIEIKPIRNVKILGKNRATLSGPDKNPLMKNYMTGKVEEPLGDFWGWRTLTISLSKCDGFEIGGFSFENARCWTLSFDICSNGYIHDLHFNTDVKNGDGIDFRSGCHNCVVEKITGFTGDDTVACTALRKTAASIPSPSKIYPGEYYLYPMEPTGYITDRTQYECDISDIIIRNVKTCGKHHGIIFLAANGCRIYNVEIDNIGEVVEEDMSLCREATVKVYTGYGSGYTKGDIKDITISNVTALYAKNAFYCNAEVENVILENVTNDNGDTLRIDYPDGIVIK